MSENEVLDYFTLSDDEKGAFCDKCNEIFPSGAWEDMQTHLKRQHGIEAKLND